MDYMNYDLGDRTQMKSGDKGEAKKIAFILQQNKDLEERTLVKNLMELIIKKPKRVANAAAFPRKYAATGEIFNRKAELIIQRLIQEPENLNEFGTETHLTDLQGEYGHELTMLDELSTQKEKAHAIVRQICEGSVLDSQPWYVHDTELIKTVNQLTTKFTAMELKELLNNRAALKNHWLLELDVLRRMWKEQAEEDAAIEKAITSFASADWLSSHMMQPYPEILSLTIKRQFLGEVPDVRQQILHIFKVNQSTITRNVALEMGGLNENVRTSWSLLNHMKLSSALEYTQHRVTGVTAVQDVYEAVRNNKPIFKHFLVTYEGTLIYKQCPLCDYIAHSGTLIARHRRRRHPNTSPVNPDQNNNHQNRNNNIAERGV